MNAGLSPTFFVLSIRYALDQIKQKCMLIVKRGTTHKKSNRILLQGHFAGRILSPYQIIRET